MEGEEEEEDDGEEEEEDDGEEEEEDDGEEEEGEEVEEVDRVTTPDFIKCLESFGEAFEEEERVRLERRQEAMDNQDLLGAGGDHPPSQTSSLAADVRTGTEDPDDQPPQPKQQKLDEGAISGLPGVTSQAPPSIPVGEVSGVKQLLPIPTDTVVREKVKEWVDSLPLEGVYDDMASESNTSIDTTQHLPKYSTG